MLPYVYPSTYGNAMHFTQNSGIYPPAYIFTESPIGSYAGGCIRNEASVKDNAREYHHDDIVKSGFGEYQLNAHTIPNYVSECQQYGFKNSAGEYSHNVIMTKEEYLDEILRNAYQMTKAKIKSNNATAAALSSYPVQRSYLRCVKRKKLKSFMVRDLIDLPTDENHSDACDASSQNQSMQPRAELTPQPETEIPLRNFVLENQRPLDTIINNKSKQYSQDVISNFVSCLANTTKSYDGEEYKPDLVYRDPTTSPEASSTCELSGMPSSPPSDSQVANSEPCSNDSILSLCGKTKRSRTIFSCNQLERLEMEFERTHYMVGSERSQLAAELELSESQVKVWFQNRRIKQRKQFHEQQQAILSKLKNSRGIDSQVEQENDANKDNAPSTTWSEESSS